jgi:hypothetical protein
MVEVMQVDEVCFPSSLSSLLGKLITEQSSVTRLRSKENFHRGARNCFGNSCPKTALLARRENFAILFVLKIACQDYDGNTAICIIPSNLNVQGMKSEKAEAIIAESEFGIKREICLSTFCCDGDLVLLFLIYPNIV